MQIADASTLSDAPLAGIAMACGLVVVLVCAWMTFATWRTWRRVRATRDAASALIEMHRSRLDDTIVDATAHMATTAEHSAVLLNGVSKLRRDADALGWILGRIPAERARLREELIDLALPTNDSAKATRRSGDPDRG